MSPRASLSDILACSHHHYRDRCGGIRWCLSTTHRRAPSDVGQFCSLGVEKGRCRESQTVCGRNYCAEKERFLSAGEVGGVENHWEGS